MEIIDFVLIIIIFVAVFAVMIFLYARISRLFKKKSYHYIVPPIPEKDKKWLPIDFHKYECFIFIKNSSEEFIVEKLNIVLENENKETNIDANDIGMNKQENWIILKINNSSFVDFKSLVWWMDDYSNEIQSPESVIGFCKHKSIPIQDYIFKVDKVLQEEIFIGSFRSGKNFGIYLPNSGLSEKGNISLSRNHEVNYYTEESKLPIELLEKKLISYEKVIKYYHQHSNIKH